MKDHLLKLWKEEEGQIEVKTPTETQSSLPDPLREARVPKLDSVRPEEVKYPGWNDWKVPEEAECQDTRGMVGGRYIRCARPAKVIVALNDDHPYYMCRECARFAVMQRGGKYLLGGSSGAGGR
jgi:hypothetical protein